MKKLPLTEQRLIPLDALPETTREIYFVRIIGLLCALTCIAAMKVILNKPELDITLIKLINGGESFILAGKPFWSGLRRALMIGFGVFYVGIIVAFFLAWSKQKALFNLWPLHWLYMILCSLLGPLLLTNMILKTYVGRPRPKFVEMFGGSSEFIGAFQSGGSCVSNCSFVSGEVSSMVMMFACLMFASQKYRKIFATILIPAWALSAYLRIGAGAHFPSDVFFAGIFMIAIAAVLYWWMFLSSAAQKRLNQKVPS